MKRQSSLLPYKNEIVTLHRKNPPVPYSQIEAIFKFIKACATAHKKDKNKSYKPCTYAHKIKLTKATQLTSVEVGSQLVLERETVTVPEPRSFVEQVSTPSVSLVSKDIEQAGGGRLTDMDAKSLSAEKEEVCLRSEREESKARLAKIEREAAEKKRLDEKALFAPENFIVADPDFCLPEDVMEKLFDMGCKFDIKTQRFYHTDIAIVMQARRLVREYLKQRNISDGNVSASRIIF